MLKFFHTILNRTIMKKLLFIILTTLIAVPGFAQPTLIQADGYIDVASGELITPANIVVENGIITSINPSSLPDEAETIDLSGSILLPGFMDMHAHLTIDFDDFFRNIIGTESGSKGAIREPKMQGKH